MHLKRPSSPNLQSPPFDNQSSNRKLQKKSKEQASKTITQNSVSLHVKRAVEGIYLKIDKNSMERVIADSETAEGCNYIMNAFIEVIDHYSKSDSVILKALEVIYILLQTSNSTFKTTARDFMPEILTITTLSFKKSKVKYRDFVHELAKSIYLYLQRNQPLPSPKQLGLEDNLSPFFSLFPPQALQATNNRMANKPKDQISFDFENTNNENIDILFNDNNNLNENNDLNDLNNLSDLNNDSLINQNDDNLIDGNNLIKEDQNNPNSNFINDLINPSPVQPPPVTDKNINDIIIFNDVESAPTTPSGGAKVNFDDDLIDCNNTEDTNNFGKSSSFSSSSNAHQSNAKQAFNDYLMKSSMDESTVSQQSSDVKEFGDSLLLITDGSNETNSTIYSSASLTTADDPNQNLPKEQIDDLLSQNDVKIQAKRPTKHFNISTEIGTSNAANFPRSKSLQPKFDLQQDLNVDSIKQQQTQDLPNLPDLIGPNQIIDLTLQPASSPNSPPMSNQNSFFDSILNTPATATGNSSPGDFSSPSKIANSLSFNSPDSPSNYNSESGSSILLNSSQYSSQFSKSNSILNASSNYGSNITLNSESTMNSVSDSILKLPQKEVISPSKTSDIQYLNPDLQSQSDSRLQRISSNHSFVETNIPSILTEEILDNTGNMGNGNMNIKKKNSSRFSVKYEYHDALSSLQKENISVPIVKLKKKFKIETKTNDSNDDSSSINISPSDASIDNLAPRGRKHRFSFEKCSNSSTQGFSDGNPSNNSIINISNNNSNFDIDNVVNFQNNNNNDEFQTSKNNDNLFSSQNNNETELNFQSKPNYGLGDAFEDQFEPITPTQGLEISPFEGNQIPTPPSPPSQSSVQTSGNTERISSILESSSDSDNTTDDRFVPITPIRSKSQSTFENSQIDDRFVPITPVSTSNIADHASHDIKLIENTNASIESDGFVPITPTRENEMSSVSDQFVPITPVKNSDAFDPLASMKNNIGSNDLFEPLEKIPNYDNKNAPFSDDINQINKGEENKLFNDFVSFNSTSNIPDLSNNINEENNSLFDQFVPIIPNTEEYVSIIDDQNGNNMNSNMNNMNTNLNSNFNITDSNMNNLSNITNMNTNLNSNLNNMNTNLNSNLNNMNTNLNSNLNNMNTNLNSNLNNMNTNLNSNLNNMNNLNSNLNNMNTNLNINLNNMNSLSNSRNTISGTTVPLFRTESSEMSNLNDGIMGSSPRSRRHLSFDSGARGNSNNGVDIFESLSPLSARSMFNYNSQFRGESIIGEASPNADTNDSPKQIQSNESGKQIESNSFSDQFEPITPPSSIQNRLNIQELYNPSPKIMFKQEMPKEMGNSETKFDESLDKELNVNGKPFESPNNTYRIDGNERKSDDFGNFDLISNVEAENNEIGEIIPNKNNIQNKRFNIKRTPPPS